MEFDDEPNLPVGEGRPMQHNGFGNNVLATLPTNGQHVLELIDPLEHKCLQCGSFAEKINFHIHHSKVLEKLCSRIPGMVQIAVEYDQIYNKYQLLRKRNLELALKCKRLDFCAQILDNYCQVDPLNKQIEEITADNAQLASKVESLEQNNLGHDMKEVQYRHKIESLNKIANPGLVKRLEKKLLRARNDLKRHKEVSETRLVNVRELQRYNEDNKLRYERTSKKADWALQLACSYAQVITDLGDPTKVRDPEIVNRLKKNRDNSKRSIASTYEGFLEEESKALGRNRIAMRNLPSVSEWLDDFDATGGRTQWLRPSVYENCKSEEEEEEEEEEVINVKKYAAMLDKLIAKNISGKGSFKISKKELNIESYSGGDGNLIMQMPLIDDIEDNELEAKENPVNLEGSELNGTNESFGNLEENELNRPNEHLGNFKDNERNKANRSSDGIGYNEQNKTNDTFDSSESVDGIEDNELNKPNESISNVNEESNLEKKNNSFGKLKKLKNVSYYNQRPKRVTFTTYFNFGKNIPKSKVSGKNTIEKPKSDENKFGECTSKNFERKLPLETSDNLVKNIPSTSNEKSLTQIKSSALDEECKLKSDFSPIDQIEYKEDGNKDFFHHNETNIDQNSIKVMAKTNMNSKRKLSLADDQNSIEIVANLNRSSKSKPSLQDYQNSIEVMAKSNLHSKRKLSLPDDENSMKVMAKSNLNSKRKLSLPDGYDIPLKSHKKIKSEDHANRSSPIIHTGVDRNNIYQRENSDVTSTNSGSSAPKVMKMSFQNQPGLEKRNPQNISHKSDDRLKSSININAPIIPKKSPEKSTSNQARSENQNKTPPFNLEMREHSVQKKSAKKFTGNSKLLLKSRKDMRIINQRFNCIPKDEQSSTIAKSVDCTLNLPRKLPTIASPKEKIVEAPERYTAHPVVVLGPPKEKYEPCSRELTKKIKPSLPENLPQLEQSSSKDKITHIIKNKNLKKKSEVKKTILLDSLICNSVKSMKKVSNAKLT